MTLFNVSCLNVDASRGDLLSLGTYIIQTPENKSTKVYVVPQLKKFVEDNGVKVYEEKKGWWVFSSSKYYYYSNKYVDRIVTSRQLYNDVDSLIFVVSELEQKAKKFLDDKAKDNKNEKPIDNPKNLVLGYIRTITTKYDDSELEWSVVTGTCNKEFINEVDSENKYGLKIKEYFAQFVEYNYYNTKVHGELDAKYRKNKNDVSYLEDSSDYGSKKRLDLIHFFGCIDGIYVNTHTGLGSTVMILGNNLQRDIVSWNGDLQQAAYDLKSDKSIDLTDYNMEHIFKMKASRAPLEDIIADIDAMNITKTYIDMEETSIANALSAYYLLVEKNKNVRFKLFIKTVLLEEERQNSNDEKERLKIEIFSEFNIIEEKNGELHDHRYYLDPKAFLGFSIMRDSIGCEIPDEEIRGFVVKSFYEYIIKNAGV